jgi:hypothetical protein
MNKYVNYVDNVETVIFNAAQALVVQQLLLQEAQIDNNDNESIALERSKYAPIV